MKRVKGGTALITFERVTKRYDKRNRPALDDISVDIRAGEFVFLVGASGSGKSTFMRLIPREERPTAGRVIVAGRDVGRLSRRKVPQLRRGMGAVFQDFRLLPTKTVFENVAFALQVIGKSRAVIRQTVPETLRIVGLEGKDKRLPHELSGGEQQRVAIARAIVNKPTILLADEPTGNLDPDTSRGIVALLDRINRSGTTVVMATHDAGIVDDFRKRVVRLAHGKMVSDIGSGDYGESVGSVVPDTGLPPGSGMPSGSAMPSGSGMPSGGDTPTRTMKLPRLGRRTPEPEPPPPVGQDRDEAGRHTE